MSYFTKLNDNDEVLQVISIDNAVVGEPELVFPQTEPLGQSYIVNTLRLGGSLNSWKQTSYNNNFRKQYAGIGYKYDRVNDVFICPQPYASWTLDENFDWQPPIPKPDNENIYLWNEDEQEWEMFGGNE